MKREAVTGSRREPPTVGYAPSPYHTAWLLVEVPGAEICFWMDKIVPAILESAICLCVGDVPKRV